jgi:hypothetical protein
LDPVPAKTKIVWALPFFQSTEPCASVGSALGLLGCAEDHRRGAELTGSPGRRSPEGDGLTREPVCGRNHRNGCICRGPGTDRCRAQPDDSRTGREDDRHPDSDRHPRRSASLTVSGPHCLSPCRHSNRGSRRPARRVRHRRARCLGGTATKTAATTATPSTAPAVAQLMTRSAAILGTAHRKTSWSGRSRWHAQLVGLGPCQRPSCGPRWWPGKSPHPRVDQVLFSVVPFLALASRIR